MSKPNYQRKAEVLGNGDYDNYRFARQTINSQYRDIPISEKNPFSSVEDATAYDAWKSANDSDNWKECERLDHARIQRVGRLKKRVRYMVQKGDCCFVTLTFSPESLEKYKPSTRREFVKRWLRQFPSAIANLDFGGQSGREHYHAIVLADSVDLDSWKYGFPFSKRIPRGDSVNIDKVSCYVAKLVNHAIKETTKGCRTIYSGSFGLPMPKDHVPKWIEDRIRRPYKEPEFDAGAEKGKFMDIPADLMAEIQDMFMEV